MGAYIKHCRRELEAALAAGNYDRDSLRGQTLTRIGFLQHERLIHLLVTLAFAVILLIAVLIMLSFPSFGTMLLCAAILALLVPYVAHYYLLENEVQKLYALYEKI